MPTLNWIGKEAVVNHHQQVPFRLLTDGRILVVEYKGGHLLNSPDAQEKHDIGTLWAARSNGRCLFVMPSDGCFDEIVKAIKKDYPASK